MFHPRDMAQQRVIPPRWEFGVGGAALLAALALRLWNLERVALSHFDEGVYASNLWFPSGEGYPARQLYAPPLLPALIELCQGAWGPGTWQPLLPTLAAGCLLPVSVWWVARRWFGSVAGLFSLWLVALSPTQTLFARSALTDSPLALAVLLGVAAAAEGIARRNTTALWCAGVCGALAWWTKWNGWLVLAITGSALPPWLWSRARPRSARRPTGTDVSRETDPGGTDGSAPPSRRTGEQAGDTPRWAAPLVPSPTQIGNRSGSPADSPAHHPALQAGREPAVELPSRT
ncbi:MAG: ArnT family glycosyltransferase, partial [Planctomycetaceae bacterium]